MTSPVSCGTASAASARRSRRIPGTRPRGASSPASTWRSAGRVSRCRTRDALVGLARLDEARAASWSGDDGMSIADTAVARALESGSPLVVPPPEDGPFVRRVVLPSRGEPSGAVELPVGTEGALSPDDVALGRMISTVTGLALAAARGRAADPARL